VLRRAIVLLLERILSAVEAHPDAPAFITADAPTTYRQMLALLSVVTGYLHGQGIQAGEPVSLTMSQSPLHIITFLALARLGALVVPVSTFLRPGDKAAVFAKYGVGTAISDREDAGVPGCRQLLIRSVQAKGTETKLDHGDFVAHADSPIRLALTSGTTGTPKATLQTHARFVQRMDRAGEGSGERPRFIPHNLHVTTALTQALHALCEGGTVVIPRGYDSLSFLDAIRRHEVTHVGLPPAHLALMIEGLSDEGPGFASLRQVLIIGDTPPGGLLALARRRFTPRLFVSYGLGEVGRVAMATPQMLEREPGTAGALLPDVRFETLDGEGRTLPRGDRGSVRVAFDGMPGSYYGPDEGDRSRFRDGWFYPGDIARLSAEGFVYLEGRDDDIINIGGRKVAPHFVESLLQEFPGVREAAVFASGEGIGGTRIAAAIVRNASLDWSELGRYAERVLDVRAPARYFEIDSLPRNAMGKILRADLASWVEAQGKLVSGTH
jgi:acyl-coenzyme A synthetase/AMP-(fatty) acid ligase